MTAAPSLEPVLKWAGGKRRLLGELRRHAPASFERYFEPFAGGAALFFSLGPARAVVSDLNADLIRTYEALAVSVGEVICRLAALRDAHSAEHYYATRARWNARDVRDGLAARAAMFLYLNKTCYNGLWRVNARGGFNVPAGRYRRPCILDAPALQRASGALQRATLQVGDFVQCVQSAASGDFVYLDPPYVPLTASASFTSYTASGFALADHQRLAAMAHALVARGVTVLASNHDLPVVRKLYRGFRAVRVSRSQAINSKASRRGPVRELVLVGRPS